MGLTPNDVDLVQIAVNLGCAVVALRASRRQGGVAARWLAATFGVLALAFLAAAVLPPDSDRALFAWARKVAVAGVLLFPYCLYRFASAFGEVRRRADRVVAGLTVVAVFATAAVPTIPGTGDARPGWWGFYVAMIVVQWTTTAALVALRLWRLGRDQATVARRRMQMMALGAVVVAAAVIVAGASGERPRLAFELVSLAGVALLVAGFAPPSFLRTVWRRTEARAVRDAEVALMQATSDTEVAGVLLPHVTRLFAGVGSALVDAEGRVVGAHNLDTDRAAAVASMPEGTPGVLAAPLQSGRIVVEASACTPFFGDEEVSYLGRFAMFTDLALTRAALLREERAARERVERAHAELETFVYSVSHDLKSPLVSLAGFLDLLRADLGAAMSDDTAYYLERMAAGAGYMQALLQALLELSRIGRVDTATTAVDLADLVREVAAEVTATAPAAVVRAGPLPIVAFNPLRARQLVTNLVANAVAHGGRPDVCVRIEAETAADGGVRMVVADDGVGIPAAHRERVFNVFERLSSAGPGTGMGLAVCRKIVEEAGGTIGVGDSVVGTRFEVDLPAAVVQQTARSLAQARS